MRFVCLFSLSINCHSLFLILPFGARNTNSSVFLWFLNKATNAASSLLAPLLPLSSQSWLQWHGFSISFSSVFIYSVILQEVLEHGVSDSRHLARVAPGPVPSHGKRDNQRRLIGLFVNEGLQNVNDKLGSILNVDRTHSLFSLIFKIMGNLWKIQFIFDFVSS